MKDLSLDFDSLSTSALRALRLVFLGALGALGVLVASGFLSKKNPGRGPGESHLSLFRGSTAALWRRFDGCKRNNAKLLLLFRRELVFKFC